MPAWFSRSIAPIHNSKSGLTGFFTKTGMSTPFRASAKACMAKGLAVVRAPIHRMSISYFKASSTCSGVATSVEISMCVSSFTCFIQGRAFSPLPSKPPGLVRGFHTPARKLWQPFMASWRAVFITCSSVSALQGPAMTKGRSLSLGRFSFSNSNSIVILRFKFFYLKVKVWHVFFLMLVVSFLLSHRARCGCSAHHCFQR